MAHLRGELSAFVLMVRWAAGQPAPAIADRNHCRPAAAHGGLPACTAQGKQRDRDTVLTGPAMTVGWREKLGLLETVTSGDRCTLPWHHVGRQTPTQPRFLPARVPTGKTSECLPACLPACLQHPSSSSPSVRAGPHPGVWRSIALLNSSAGRTSSFRGRVGT